MKFLGRLSLWLAIAALTLTAGLYAYLLFTDNPDHFWRRVGGARVTSGGTIITEARVYRHPDGELLMNLGEGEGRGWRIYRPDRRNVGLCNPITSIPLPGYIFAPDCGSGFCPCVLMGGAKVEEEAQLTGGSNFIEFNSFGERINVSW